MNLMEQQAFDRLDVENEMLRSEIKHKDDYIAWLEDMLDELEGKLGERK